jgi:hypothetical protein
MTISRTWSRANPRRSGGSLAESSGGSVKEKGEDITTMMNAECGMMN